MNNEKVILHANREDLERILRYASRIARVGEMYVEHSEVEFQNVEFENFAEACEYLAEQFKDGHNHLDFEKALV